MTTEPEVVDVNVVTLAVAETLTHAAEIPARIRGVFDHVYKWLPTAPVHQTGNNYAIYDQFSSGEMRMRCGVPVSARFQNDGHVHCVDLASGRAARIRHQGPYRDLHEAHARLNAWCKDRALEDAGESWEIYGDWSNDESQLVTDIYIRLR